MMRSLPPLALACALAACANDAPQDAAPGPAPQATPPDAGEDAGADAGDTRLTIFSGDYEALAAGHGGGETGYAFVRRQLHFDLSAGANRVAISDLPQGLDVAAASLRPTTEGVTVGAQRFLAPLQGAQQVFARALGRRVAVDHTSGGARQTDNGILVAAGDGLTLALSDGRYKVIREFDSLSVLDTQDLPGAEPQLGWVVEADTAGTAGFLFEYPTGGLAWRAEYLGRLADAGEAGCRMSLGGWAMVANHAGARFEDAALTLVAGQPNRVPEPQEKRMRYAAAAPPPPPPVMQASAMPVERRAGEYHAYDLPGRTTLASGGIERVPLFAPVPAVACTRTYETQPPVSAWVPQRPVIEPGFNGSTGRQPVSVVVEFANTTEAGLGRPLPAGRARLFDGEDFLGESQLQHTPAGQEIRMEVGTAFDLTAERERTAFNVDRAGRTMTESFEVTLANATDDGATVNVVEPMPRWSDWTITESSVPAERRDAQHATFEVPVPGNGEARLTYTVRYRWPAGMRP